MWRLIEDQGTTSTRKLVDSLDEQILLEQMIEEIKQLIPEDCTSLHPLLYTPFRYPPLPHGSRFGKRYERSVWYGSERLTTAMAEMAYYRFFFLGGSEADFGLVVTYWTGFSTQVETNNAVKLTSEPFAKTQPDAHSLQSWQCVTDHKTVEFERTSSIDVDVNRFPLDLFLVAGVLPSPAA